MKKIVLVILVCAIFLAGCAVVSPSATETGIPTQQTTAATPTPDISASIDPNATPSVKPTEVTLSASDVVDIYQMSMNKYKSRSYYDFHAKMVCSFTADGQTNPIYKRDLIAQGKNIKGDAQFYSHLLEELYQDAGGGEQDWTIWDQYFYNDYTDMFMKLTQTWTKYPGNNRDIKQYCTLAKARDFVDMLASRINCGTYVSINEVTGVTSQDSGANTVYTFSLDKAKVKTLVQYMLSQKQLSEEFTINTCTVAVTVDAQNNVIKDELTANVDVTFNGIAGKLDISDFTEYLSQTSPQINVPDWIGQAGKVEALTP